MGVIGHNGGPVLQPASGWKLHCWQQARAALLPTLPVEVVRMRVARARELGLDYKTYAGVRAQTGHDVVAFLFSSNALRAMPQQPQIPPDHAARLAALQAVGRIGLAQRPLTARDLARNPELDAAHPAPAAFASFRDQAACLRAALGTLPGDRVILIAETALEREWCAAGRLAACLPAAAFFGTGVTAAENPRHSGW